MARRPDSDTPEDMFRRYEIPGAAHINQNCNDNMPCAADTARAGIPAGAANCEGVVEYGVTDFPIEFFMNSAYNNLYTWLRKGTPPPKADPIETEELKAGEEFHVKLDAHGNALGGVRNPYVDIPTATYYGQSNPLDEASAFFCMLAGHKVPFDDDKIQRLYPTREDYLNRVNAMVDKMVEERFLTESDGKQLKASASQSILKTGRSGQTSGASTLRPGNL